MESIQADEESLQALSEIGVKTTLRLVTLWVLDMCTNLHIKLAVTVINLISEHTLFSVPPTPHFNLFKFLYINNYLVTFVKAIQIYYIYRPDGHNGEDYCQST